MLRKGKKRISITVDAESLDRVSALLEERGYPFGSLSSYLNDCIVNLNEYLDPADEDRQRDPILELEISRVGLKAAAEKLGMKVIKWDPEDEKPRRR